MSCQSAHHDHSHGSLDAESGSTRGPGKVTQTCEGLHPLPPWPPPCSYLVANDVNLVLYLGHPLAHNGKQLWDGGLRVKQNLLARWVIGVEEGEG